MTAELTGLAGPRAVESPSVASPAVTPLQAWITQFLQSRGHKGPVAQPLHRYQITAAELAQLKELLRTERAHIEHPSWAAAFCLCAAESYRREHGGDAASFDWHALEQSFESPLEDEQRTQLIGAGLAYWKRPRLAGEGATGAMLTREGGLPWKPVLSHEREIDAAIRQGLRRFHLTSGAGLTSAALLADSTEQLAAAFRGLDTRELLAGIVEQLMLLAREHPLIDQPDPAAYLDQQAPGWQGTFPFPVDEPEARRLLGPWLIEAAKRHQQHATAGARTPGCRHRLLDGASSHWRLVAELSLPAEESFPVDLRSLSSTRLVAAVYEGERLALNAGTVHAVAQEEGLKVQYPPLAFAVERQDPRAPLSLRLLESGRSIHALPFDGSALEIDELPLVFVTHDEEQWLAGAASCCVPASQVLIRVPPGAQHDSATELFTEEGGARWIETHTGLTVRQGTEVYRIELNHAGPAPETPALQGARAQLPAAPGRVFQGWPSLAPADGAAPEDDDRELLIDGKPLAAHADVRVGSFLASVRSSAGDTLLKERISVLPAELALSGVPASGDSPAKVIVTGAAGAHWALHGEGVSVRGEAAADPLEISLIPQGQPPAGLHLELNAPGVQPVTLPLAYPSPGARLIDRAGCESRLRDLTLDELQDARIVLAPASASGQDLHLQLDLLSSNSIGLRHHHIIRVGDSPAVITLGGYLGQIQQMLGSVDDPDAYVRLAVETDQPLLQINIRPFGALLESAGSGSYRVRDNNGGSASGGVVPLALPLEPGGGSSLPLAEEAETEVFDAAALAGSWLIYPSADSRIRFRPEIHTGDGGAEPGASSVLLQPVADAELIDPLLTSMAADLDHEGWQRLDELKTSLRHLPLATFQVWRSLSRQPDALAAALLRLSADERFCGRIHDELAVLWEAIPVETWVKAFGRFRTWAGNQGLLPAQLAGLLENRQRLLHAVVPGLDSTGDYLRSGQRAALKKPPIELVLPYHYQELRRTHQANARWPTELAAPLSTWLDRQRLPRIIKKLSNTAYSDAVTYLPIYMAHVTAGKASLTTLPGDPAYVRLVIRKISEFDRGWYLYVHSLLVSYLLAADS